MPPLPTKARASLASARTGRAASVSDGLKVTLRPALGLAFRLSVAQGRPLPAAITEKSSVEQQFRLRDVTPFRSAGGTSYGAYSEDVAEAG